MNIKFVLHQNIRPCPHDPEDLSDASHLVLTERLPIPARGPHNWKQQNILLKLKD